MEIMSRKIIDSIVEERKYKSSDAYKELLDSPIVQGYTDDGFNKIKLRKYDGDIKEIAVLHDIIVDNLQKPEAKDGFCIEILGRKVDVDVNTFTVIRAIILTSMIPNEEVGIGTTAAIKDWFAGNNANPVGEGVTKYAYDYIYNQLIQCVDTTKLGL